MPRDPPTMARLVRCPANRHEGPAGRRGSRRGRRRDTRSGAPWSMAQAYRGKPDQHLHAVRARWYQSHEDPWQRTLTTFRLRVTSTRWRWTGSQVQKAGAAKVGPEAAAILVRLEKSNSLQFLICPRLWCDGRNARKTNYAQFSEFSDPKCRPAGLGDVIAVAFRCQQRGHRSRLD